MIIISANNRGVIKKKRANGENKTNPVHFAKVSS